MTWMCPKTGRPCVDQRPPGPRHPPEAWGCPKTVAGHCSAFQKEAPTERPSGYVGRDYGMSTPAIALQYLNEGAWTDRPLGWFDVLTGPNDTRTFDGLVEQLRQGWALNGIRLGPGVYRVIDAAGRVVLQRRIAE